MFNLGYGESCSSTSTLKLSGLQRSILTIFFADDAVETFQDFKFVDAVVNFGSLPVGSLKPFATSVISRFPERASLFLDDISKFKYLYPERFKSP